MNETVLAMQKPGLDSLTDAQLAACARRLASRSNLRSSLNGKDASDFVQEAVRKLIEGQRRVDSRVAIEENVLRIGLSLVWSERQRRRQEALADDPTAAAEASSVGLPDLHAALTDAARILQAAAGSARVNRDATDFVACLLQQIDRGESIKPGHIAQILEISTGRAYAAWRRVKSLLREHLERKDHD